MQLKFSLLSRRMRRSGSVNCPCGIWPWGGRFPLDLPPENWSTCLVRVLVIWRCPHIWGRSSGLCAKQKLLRREARQFTWNVAFCYAQDLFRALKTSHIQTTICNFPSFNNKSPSWQGRFNPSYWIFMNPLTWTQVLNLENQFLYDKNIPNIAILF